MRSAGRVNWARNGATLLVCGALLALAARAQDACSYVRAGTLQGLPLQLPITHLSPGAPDWHITIPVVEECWRAGAQAAGWEALACDGGGGARPCVRALPAGASLLLRRAACARGLASVQITAYCVFPHTLPSVDVSLNMQPAQPNVLPAQPNVLPVQPNLLPAQPNVFPAQPEVQYGQPNMQYGPYNIQYEQPIQYGHPNMQYGQQMQYAQPDNQLGFLNMLPVQTNMQNIPPSMQPRQSDMLPAQPIMQYNQQNMQSEPSPELSSLSTEEEDEADEQPESSRRLLQPQPEHTRRSEASAAVEAGSLEVTASCKA